MIIFCCSRCVVLAAVAVLTFAALITHRCGSLVWSPMDSQVSEICRSAFYHIRALRHIRPVITDEVAKTIACSFVTSRLDYANSVLMESRRKIFIAFSECRTPSHESFLVLRRLSSATLPICCVICTGYLFSSVYSLN